MSAPLQGTLSLYQSEPVALPVFETRPDLPNKLVFVPGLTDTIGVVPYLERLATALHAQNYSLVQPIKGSDLGGFGSSSLEGDAQEIAQVIRHLERNGASGKVVLMGHSTGCQDTITFLSGERGVKVHGAVLQAPVSDCEYFDAHKTPADDELLKRAASLVAEGRSGDVLPRTAAAKPGDAQNGNSAAVLQPPMTAYRFQSLNGRGGDDDMFSSGLSDNDIRRVWTPALARAPILALMGEKDEFVPDSVDRVALVNRWAQVLSGSPLETKIVPGANHKVDDAAAQEFLVSSVLTFLLSLP